MKKWTSLLLGLTMFFNMSTSALGAQIEEKHIEIFVEVGSTGGDGTYKNPFGTFEEARDYIRTLKSEGNYPENGVTVNFREGIYKIDKTISLNEEDSGTEAGPVVYKAYQNEDVEFVGGIYFEPQEFDGVTETDAIGRINADVISNVKQIPLSQLELTAEDFGEIALRGSGASFLFDMGYENDTPNAELYCGEESMVIARYPNLDYENYGESYALTEDIIEEGTDASITDMALAQGMTFKCTIPAEKLSKWSEEEDIFLHGFWYYDWSDSTAKLSEIDATEQTISTLHPSAYKIRSNQRFYAFNILSELDAPGEWYLDKGSENLYVYPKGNDKIFISLLSKDLLYALNANDVKIEGITFKGSRINAIVARNCKNFELSDLRVSCCGKNGVVINNSYSSGIKNSEIFSIGGYAAGISGGDFTTLTKGESYIDNCSIHDFAERDMTNTPGIHLSGVGNTVSHCEIYNAPHQAIRFNGNDNIMEYNDIHNVLRDADDAAAIYSYRGATKRGNVVRNNYIHDLISYSTTNSSTGVGIFGVYDDGGMCGTTIERNVFKNIKKSGGAVMLGHRDTTVKNNIIIDCYSVVRVTGGGLRSLISGAEYDASLQGLTGDYYKKEPYTKYDHLSNMLEDEPLVKKYNVVKNNIDYRPTQFWGFSKDIVYTHFPQNDALKEYGITMASLYPDATEEELLEIENGLKLNENDDIYIGREYINRRNSFSESIRTNKDPGLADVAAGDYSVPENSAIYSTFPDFEAPDFKNIGLRKEPTFSVDKVAAKDSGGNKILKLSSETDKVTVSVDFKTEEGVKKNVLLLVGLYDESGKLLKSDFTEDEITPQNTQLSLNNFSGCDQQNVYLRCYIWERFGTLIPLDISYRY